MFALIANVLAHKLVNLIIWRVCEDIVAIVVVQVLIFLSLSLRDGLAKLPIGLTVKLICLDENGATRLSCLEQNQVCRYALALSDFDDLSNLDVHRCDRHDASKSALRALQHCVLRIIKLFVASVAIEVVPALLDHRHQKYKGQWRDVSEEEANFKEGHELADCNDQEEHVKEELELVVQHLEDECQDVVLLVVKPVRDEVPRMGRSVHEELPFLQKASNRPKSAMLA